MKILIADDEASIADALSAILRRKNHETKVVYDGKCAYDAASSEFFDGIILDIMMPHMDGVEVMQKLRADGNTTPVLLLTAKSQVEDKIEGLTQGADDYVAKPFDIGELIARIDGMFRRSKMTNTKLFTYGNLTLSVSDQFIRCGDIALSLSGDETKVMQKLITNPEKIVSSDSLRISDETENETFLYISYLKNKLRALHADSEVYIDGSNGYVLRKKETCR